MPPTGDETATVTFEYRAPTQLRDDLPRSARQCADEVGVTHIHPSWLGFTAIPLERGDRGWTIVLAEVPVGRSSIRISDPSACTENPTGAVTRGVFANGVELRTVVDTPGMGPEPGLAFTLTAEGTVSP